MILNKKEIGLGVATGAAFVFLVGPVGAGILTGILGFFWAAGGSGAGRAWRYLGVPFSILAAITISSGGLPSTGAIIGTVFSAVVLTCGYGIPTTQPVDAGSFFGRFFFEAANDLFPINTEKESAEGHKLRIEQYATLMVRGFLGFLFGLSYFLAFDNLLTFAGFLVALVALHIFVVQFIEGEVKI